MDPRAKPPEPPSDDMISMMEMRYERVLNQSMLNLNQNAEGLYHHATYSTRTHNTTPQSPIENVVSRLSYKPNAKLWVEGNHMLVIAIDCPERNNARETIPVVSRQQIPPGMVTGHDSTETMVGWVRDCIRQLEEHEMDEWLRLDKKLWHDPHAAEIRIPKWDCDQ
jgi:hypothetical protein